MQPWKPLHACVVGFALAVCLRAAEQPALQSDSTFFNGRLAAGLPSPAVPDDNPLTDAKVQLGRRLFYDTRLSGNETYSCASCHQQARAFTDGRNRAVGSTGEIHPRNALSLTNVAYNSTYGWADPLRPTLESQMEVPMYNEHPVELGLKGHEDDVLARFTGQPEDVARFREAFPAEQPAVTIRNVVKAIASFERVLLSGDSPLDRYLYHDDRSALSAAARRGLDLFFSSRLHCSECHSGFNLSGSVRFQGSTNTPAAFHNTGLLTRDPGLFAVTHREADTGRFRAPTLRNIGVTAPYMHDGSIATLDGVIDHYAEGGHPNPSRSELVRGFAISASEKADLIEFLESLTDTSFLANPAFSDPHIK